MKLTVASYIIFFATLWTPCTVRGEPVSSAAAEALRAMAQAAESLDGLHCLAPEARGKIRAVQEQLVKSGIGLHDATKSYLREAERMIDGGGRYDESFDALARGAAQKMGAGETAERNVFGNTAGLYASLLRDLSEGPFSFQDGSQDCILNGPVRLEQARAKLNDVLGKMGNLAKALDDQVQKLRAYQAESRQLQANAAGMKNLVPVATTSGPGAGAPAGSVITGSSASSITGEIHPEVLPQPAP